MDWTEALEIAIARTRHERLRWLCSDANPDVAQRDGYRRTVLILAGQPPPPPPPPPPSGPSPTLGVPLGGCCG